MMIPVIKLQNLWDELRTFGFDLSWLSPHFHSALGMKNYEKRAAQVTKLKENVADARRHLQIAESKFKVATTELVRAEYGFLERNLDDELGYGIP